MKSFLIVDESVGYLAYTNDFKTSGSKMVCCIMVNLILCYVQKIFAVQPCPELILTCRLGSHSKTFYGVITSSPRNN